MSYLRRLECGLGAVRTGHGQLSAGIVGQIARGDLVVKREVVKQAGPTRMQVLVPALTILASVAICAMTAGCVERKPAAAALPAATTAVPGASPEAAAVVKQAPATEPANAAKAAAPTPAATPAATAAPTPTPTPADRAALAKPTAVGHDLLQDRLVEYIQLTRKVRVLPLGARKEGEVLSVAVATRGERGVVDRLIATKDGRVFLENAIDLDEQIRLLGDDRRFAGCLIDAGIRVFIDSSKRLDQKQLAVIGRFSNTIAVDCRGAGKAECVKLKIAKTPMWLLGTARVEGAKPRSWLEAASACK
jgi:hypothetical protein